jgi:hypothetical protein
MPVRWHSQAAQQHWNPEFEDWAAAVSFSVRAHHMIGPRHEASCSLQMPPAVVAAGCGADGVEWRIEARSLGRFAIGRGSPAGGRSAASEDLVSTLMRVPLHRDQVDANVGSSPQGSSRPPASVLLNRRAHSHGFLGSPFKQSLRVSAAVERVLMLSFGLSALMDHVSRCMCTLTFDVCSVSACCPLLWGISIRQSKAARMQRSEASRTRPKPNPIRRT